MEIFLPPQLPTSPIVSVRALDLIVTDLPLSELERRTLEEFDSLEPEDRQRMLMVVAAMRAGIEIDPADMQGKTPEELRLFADRL